MLGAGKTVVKTLSNTQTAAFRGMADTWDAAKEGSFGGLVEHVASHILGVNNLINAAKTGNMANYVSASFFVGSHSDRATRYLQNEDVPQMIPAPKNEYPNSHESLFERLNHHERS